MTEDGPVAVSFQLTRDEPRLDDGGRILAYVPKGATVSVLWGGQMRRIRVSSERGHQFANEMERA